MDPRNKPEVFVYADQSPSWMTGPLIQVAVGTGETSKTLSVFRDLITARSKFFKTALNGRWAEADNNTVKLPEDRPDLLEKYLQLLYLNSVPVREKIDLYTSADGKLSGPSSEKKKRSDQEIHADVKAASNQEFDIIIHLYIFCDKIQDAESKNLLITAFLEAFQIPREDGFRYHCGASRVLTQLYEAMAPGDNMRKLIVDTFLTLRSPEGWQGTHPSRWEKDFMAQRDAYLEYFYDLTVALMHKRNPPARMLIASDYHEPLEDAVAEDDERIGDGEGDMDREYDEESDDQYDEDSDEEDDEESDDEHDDE